MRTIWLILAIASALAAAEPSAAELETALAEAFAAWNVAGVPVTLEFYAPNPCRANDEAMITAVMETTATIVYEGTGEPVSGAAAAKTYAYIIRINTNCDWRRRSLARFLTHEAGHILIGVDYHSRDPRSIMYPVVGARRDQKILDCDQDEYDRRRAARSE